MSVKEHYENHLGNIYSWMAGDFNTAQSLQETFFSTNGITPNASKVAIDLGLATAYNLFRWLNSDLMFTLWILIVNCWKNLNKMHIL